MGPEAAARRPPGLRPLRARSAMWRAAMLLHSAATCLWTGAAACASFGDSIDARMISCLVSDAAQATAGPT